MNMNKTLFAIVLCAAGLQGAGSITGVVVDQSDAPIPGSTVKLRGDGIDKRAELGPDGRFTFADLAPGAYSVAASHIGFATMTWKADVANDGVDLGRLMLPIAITMNCPQGKAREPDIGWLDGTPGIDGIVEIPARLSANAVTIRVRATGGDRQGRSVTPDGNGRFSVSGLASGKYSLTVHADNHIDFVIDTVVVKEGKRTLVNSGLPLSRCPKGVTCAPIKKISMLVICE
jgi:hypothetical protein